MRCWFLYDNDAQSIWYTWEDVREMGSLTSTASDIPLFFELGIIENSWKSYIWKYLLSEWNCYPKGQNNKENKLLPCMTSGYDLEG